LGDLHHWTIEKNINFYPSFLGSNEKRWLEAEQLIKRGEREDRCGFEGEWNETEKLTGIKGVERHAARKKCLLERMVPRET